MSSKTAIKEVLPIPKFYAKPKIYCKVLAENDVCVQRRKSILENIESKVENMVEQLGTKTKAWHTWFSVFFSLRQPAV